MIEEIPSFSWPLDMVFCTLVGITVCTLTSFMLLELAQEKIKDFIIYAFEMRVLKWYWFDFPFIIGLAIVVGVLTSWHTRGMLFFNQVRNEAYSVFSPQDRKRAFMKSVVGYSAICVVSSILVSWFSSWFVPCEERPRSDVDIHLQFNCPDGQYNPVATLLINTSHSSIRLLFSDSSDFQCGPTGTLLAFALYYSLSICMSGLPVPGGAFTATMFLGSLFGHSIGSIIKTQTHLSSSPRIYALVGCAGFLCGFKQMTAAVVLICIQCVNDINVAPQLMVGVSVSMAVNRMMNPYGHDEQAIKTRCLPWLHPQVPDDVQDVLARALMTECWQQIPASADIAILRKRLGEDESADYFIVDTARTAGDVSLGIVARLIVEKACNKEDVRIYRDGIDLAPFTIHDTMPLGRFYRLFSKEGERAAVVVGHAGDPVGYISRNSLIDYCHKNAD